MSCPQDCLGRVSVSSEYSGLGLSEYSVGLWILGGRQGEKSESIMKTQTYQEEL